jgi:MFS family permease
MAGIAVFALASLAGGLAQDQAWLLTARVVQGIGGALAAPTSLSLIAVTFVNRAPILVPLTAIRTTNLGLG